MFILFIEPSPLINFFIINLIRIRDIIIKNIIKYFEMLELSPILNILDFKYNAMKIKSQDKSGILVLNWKVIM